ncbi:hypothetical protein AABB24_036479 [Solanum stoloniferum]|uniref:Uncharacterized protein n=1 Tax=Solanum stoloniferum TaxID=62892 RepID=A0ABD2RC36_9SOLN
MGSKAFLLIVLAIFLVINSEVAARKLGQSFITSLKKGVALPPIGGMFDSEGVLGIGAPIGVRGLFSEIGAPIGFKSGQLIEIGAPIESEGLP